MGERKIVRGLTRGLEILRVLNERSEASAADLSAATGLPRATVYRLLDTLVEEGYVAAAPDTHTYRPTIACRTLSDGYHDEIWMRDIAAPVIAALGDELVWPTDIATRHDDSMVIRATTHRSSPLSFHRARVGSMVPVMGTSLGLAYLAFCPEAERQAVIATAAAKDGPHNALARQPKVLARMLDEIRARGYGVRDGGIVPETGSFAVPVMNGRRCIAAINVQYILSAMSTEEAVRRYLAPMRQAAAQIEAALGAGPPQST